VVLPPREPEHKGIAERNNDYLETSFLPGREFASPADFNAQQGEWMALANSRFKRVPGCAPADRIAADRAAMAALPPIAESSLGWHNRIRLPRDHYVRIDTCDYSVDPAVIGRMVAVRADLEQVIDRTSRFSALTACDFSMVPVLRASRTRSACGWMPYHLLVSTWAVHAVVAWHDAPGRAHNPPVVGSSLSHP
jgi:hypothetical protein